MTTDGVSIITLSRPERSNAVDIDFALAFHEAVDEVVSDRDVRVVLLRSVGRAFCVGGDILRVDLAALPQYLRAITDELHPAIEALSALPVPVVVAVQGAAAGAGLGIALAGDIIVAAASARFVVAYAAVGLSPDAGVSCHLPHRIGHAAALELALTNRPLSAPEAYKLGLVQRVVADDELERETSALVDAVACRPRTSVVHTTRLFRSHAELHASLDDEAELLQRSAADAAAVNLILRWRHVQDRSASELHDRGPA